MGVEIERKFLVRSDEWRGLSRFSERLRQGYLCWAENGKAEIRIRCAESRAFITIKGKGGLLRSEFEYGIPRDDGEKILSIFCQSSLIDKFRHELEHEGVTWYIDEFLGNNSGLVLAEVELESADQTIDLPGWVGKEVTEAPRYRNANIAANPQVWRQKNTE
jgi:adenylate cyclase